jgi:hypothetical protein
MTPRDRQLTVHTLAPLLLLFAVGTAILAQLWSAIPLAGAVALAGWGTAIALAPRPGRYLLAALVYGPLVVVAITAQLDAASDGSLVRQFFAALDAGVAGALIFRLIRRA